METKPSIRPWHAMSGREQAIWTAAFAKGSADSIDAGRAALNADRAVTAWRELELDEDIEPPEIELARRNIVMTPDAFAVWYPIAHRVSYGRRHGYRPPTADECHEAYVRFDRGRTDFF